MHVLRAKIYTKLIVVCGFLIALTDCRNKKDVPITSTVCAKKPNMFSSGLVEAEFQSQWKQMPWPKLFKSSVNSLWKVSFRRRSFYVSYQWPWFSPFLSERNVCRQSHSFYVVFSFFFLFLSSLKFLIPRSFAFATLWFVYANSHILTTQGTLYMFETTEDICM